MNPRLMFAALSMLVLAACKKDNADTNKPPADSKYLTLILNPDYMPASMVDSALITWQNGDSYDTVILSPRNNDLGISFNKLPVGEKKYELHIYSSQKLAYHKTYFYKEFVTDISKKNALNIAAPISLQDPNWLPRVIVRDQAGLMAFSGIRPTDPYFRIHKVDKSWKSIVADRSYWNTVGTDTKVGGGEWKGTNVLDASGSYENRTFYTFLPAQIGNRAWDHIEVVMLFTNNSNTLTRVIDFNYTFK